MRTPILLLALAACSLRAFDFEPTATEGDDAAPTTSTTDASTTSPLPPPGTTSTTTAATTDATGSSSGPQPFIQDNDGGGSCAGSCDQWHDDCPEGMKCTPYSGDGDDVLESEKCVDLVPNPAGPGEPCTILGSGEDTCDKHLLCRDVDPDTGTGTCARKCSGSPDEPICPDGDTCLIANDGVLILCQPSCDPLLQDCGDADACVANPHDPAGFLCVSDASGDEGQAFDPCEQADACDPGLLCVDPQLAAECDPTADGCCLPLCDLTDWTCPGAGQQCLPWYEEGTAPPGREVVGLCGLTL